jgi:proteasome lid subunit RPN8/RPN11
MSAPGEGIGKDAAFLSQLLPVDDLVHWRSTSAPTTASFAEPYPIVLQQMPLGQILTHIHSAPARTLLGFLLGGLFECPKSGVRYVVITEIVHVRAEVPGDQTSDMLARLWPQLQEKLEANREQVIGWYHTHPHGSLELSREDVAAHMTYFTQPWQAGLVLGAEEGKPAAAWFRATAEANWNRVQLPFYEWLTPESEAGAKKRSFVPWGNYKGYRTTWPLPRAAAPAPPAPEAPRPPLEVRPVVEPPAPAPRLEERLPPRPPLEEQAPAPAVHLPLVSTRRPRAAARTLLRPAPPASAGWKIWVAGIVGGLLVGGVVAAGWALGLVRFGRVPGAASGAEEGTAPGVEAAARGSAVDPRVTRLDALADSLQQAVGDYRARRARFDGRQASCPPLAQALVALEEHWMGYNARGKPRDLTLDSGRAVRDRSLYARVDSIETDFDRSDCQRP